MKMSLEWLNRIFKERSGHVGGGHPRDQYLPPGSIINVNKMTLTCRDNKTVQTFICVETFVPGSNRMKENSFNYLTNLYQLSNRF